MGLEYSTALGGVTGTIPSWSDFGGVVKGRTYDTAAVLAGMMHRYGETNRYAKIAITTNDGPRIPKPAILERIQYQRHQYSPLYHGVPATTPLVGEGKPVRLLELLPPNQRDVDMVCGKLGKLHVHSLEKAPPFTAISYAWGVDKAQDFPLFIVNDNTCQEKAANSEAIQITPQLYAALRRIRDPREPILVWADQICINQMDKDEKSQQVRQMGDIYRKSKLTVIWLGEEDSDKDIIETIFNKLRSTPFNSLKEDVKMMSELIDVKGPTHLLAPEQLGRHAVERLLNRTWFSRVWVFEESVVSKEVEVRYGSLSLSLSDLFRLTRAVFTAENFVGGYPRSIAKRTVGFDTLYLVQHSRGGCGDSECPRDKVQKAQPSFLGLVMQALQQLHATKEVDLIYAFTGLDSLESLKIRIPKIEIDYTLPVRTVWINAARSIIQSSNSLDIFATARGQATCKYDIPSWVPDFLHCYPYGRPITAPDFITAFNASGGFSHTWEEADNIDTLIVKGKVIGTIMWFSPMNFELKHFWDELQGVKAVLQYEAHAEEVATYMNIHLGAGKSDELLGDRRKILRTILADGAFGNDQPLNDMKEIIQVYENEDKIRKQTDNERQFSNSQYKILEALREWALIAQQKKLFLSDGYDVGLVPKTAKMGDLICLLYGSKVPCVLRQTADSEERYRIISQCYLDGQMYCEGLSERREFLRKDSRKFLLV
ncbi:hypothetical protein ZTR_09192 [Talaromyces verruculosus]|nr:hypothetical protein ZTR_09192 [Talaromyces verruculosus]